MNCWSVQWRTLHVHHRSRLSISHVKISRIKLGLHAREHLNPLPHSFPFYVSVCSPLIDPMNVSFVYLANYFIVCPCPLSIPKPLLLQLAVPLICHSESRYIYWYQFDIGWSSYLTIYTCPISLLPKSKLYFIYFPENSFQLLTKHSLNIVIHSEYAPYMYNVQHKFNVSWQRPMHNIKFHLVFINDFLEHSDKNVLIICTLKSRPWTNNKLNGAQNA